MANPQPIPFVPPQAGGKSPEAFRTISEVAAELDLPQHVLRFWETRFAAVRPLKRSGGRRYYRPEDVALLRRIRDLLREKGYTIKGVQKLLRHGGERPAPDAGGDVVRIVDKTTQPAPDPSENSASGNSPSENSPSGNSNSERAALDDHVPRAGGEAPSGAISPEIREELAAVLAELEALRLLVKAT